MTPTQGAAALEVFHLQDGDLSNELLVSAAAIARGWTDDMEQPSDQNATETDLRNVPMDIISVNSSEVDCESSGGDESSDGEGDDTSSSSLVVNPQLPKCLTNTPCWSTCMRPLKMCSNVNRDGKLKGGMATLNLMEIFPPQWPLARLTLPLKSFVHRLDRLICGYLMELAATHYVPEQCHRNIAKSAKILTVRVATYLVKINATLALLTTYALIQQNQSETFRTQKPKTSPNNSSPLG